MHFQAPQRQNIILKIQQNIEDRMMSELLHLKQRIHLVKRTK